MPKRPDLVNVELLVELALAVAVGMDHKICGIQDSLSHARVQVLRSDHDEAPGSHVLEKVGVMVRGRVRSICPRENGVHEPIRAKRSRVVQIELVSGRVATGAAKADSDSPGTCGVVLQFD